jgi:hypothetical protein
VFLRVPGGTTLRLGCYLPGCGGCNRVPSEGHGSTNPCRVVEFVASGGFQLRPAAVAACYSDCCAQMCRPRSASHGIHRKVESEPGKRDGGMSILTNIQMSPAQAELSKVEVPSLGITQGTIETDIPARLDSLPWSGFHDCVIAALGITWILDGLEVLYNQHWHRRHRRASAVRRSDRHQLAQQRVCRLSARIVLDGRSSFHRVALLH